MAPHHYDDAPPPTYQDALVDGILRRTGATPFPDAPRLAIRNLELDPILEKPHRSSSKSIPQTANSNAASPPSSYDNPYDKFSRSHTNSRSNHAHRISRTNAGWQSDTSYSRSSSSGRKKINEFKPPPLKSVSPPPPTGTPTLSPLLSYSAYRPTPIYIDFSKPLSHIRFVSGDIPIKITDTDLDALATSPPSSQMIITSQDQSWSLTVRARKGSLSGGVTYRDILSKIRTHLFTRLTQQEWDMVREPYRNRVKLAFEARCRSSEGLDEVERKQGLRKVDLLAGRDGGCIWRGLVENEQGTGWTLILGSSSPLAGGGNVRVR